MDERRILGSVVVTIAVVQTVWPRDAGKYHNVIETGAVDFFGRIALVKINQHVLKLRTFAVMLPQITAEEHQGFRSDAFLWDGTIVIRNGLVTQNSKFSHIEDLRIKGSSDGKIVGSLLICACDTKHCRIILCGQKLQRLLSSCIERHDGVILI